MARVYLDPRSSKSRAVRRWVIDYVGLDRKRVRERTMATTKGQAEALLHAKIHECAKAQILGVTTVQSVRPMPFSEYLLGEYMDHCRSTHTLRTFQVDGYTARTLVEYFKTSNLRSITSGEVQKMVDRSVSQITRTGRPIRPGTINKRLMFLSGAMSEAVKRGYIDRNPVTGIKQLHEHNDRLRFLSNDEEDRLMAVMPEWLKPIVLTALHTGMRVGEIQRLTWEDLDFKRRQVTLALTKNHKTRYVPMNDILVATLRSVLRYTGPLGPSPFVFTNPKTGKAYLSFTHGLQAAAKTAEVSGICFHTLRHTFASRLAQAGVPLNTIRELLGHGSMDMTLRYAHLSPNNHKSAVDVLAQAQPMQFLPVPVRPERNEPATS
ncbi:MAG: phage integrase family [Planctomycetota bacterium]|nr:MAG: phage integrase family [Planctomycetota bacterium]